MRLPVLSFACFPIVVVASNAMAAQPPAAQLPGPSQALFNSPYYSCISNYYVSTSGNDSNAGTSSSTAWRTLQHANDTKPRAGSCINIAPGSYAGVRLTSGGNLASSTGYVVYRCATLLGCTISGTAGDNGNAGFWAQGFGAANYVQIDGFKIAGNNSIYGAGVITNGHCCGVSGTFGSHHLWVLNSAIYGFGDAGIAFSSGDYTYAIHNRVFQNAAGAGCDAGAQGSGIANNIALDIKYGYPNYVPTADDKVNPNPLIGSFVTGSAWFHNVYEYNRVFKNHLSPCTGSTSADTDGNGIILDTFSEANGNAVDYPDQTLIAYNVVYNNGGAGIHVFFSEYATVANNSSYNNGLDPYKAGGGSAIDTNQSYGNTIINNIAVAIPAANNGTCSWSPVPPYADFNNAILGGGMSGKPADTFSNNVSQLQGGHPSCWGVLGVSGPTGETPMFNGDTYSCSTNKCATNAQWVNVGTASAGSMKTLPNGSNFALQAGSPAIGYGLTRTFLPASSVDAGACSSRFTNCQ